jgi:hypothetical protein
VSGLRLFLGTFGGLIVVASSAAHSLLGWKQLRADLTLTQAPPHLVAAIMIGWHFAGAAMLTFGCIVLWTFANLWRRQRVSLRPAQLISLVYLAFGVWALVVSKWNPFFIVFVVPGAMLLAATLWPAAYGSDQRL